MRTHALDHQNLTGTQLKACSDAMATFVLRNLRLDLGLVWVVAQPSAGIPPPHAGCFLLDPFIVRSEQSPPIDEETPRWQFDAGACPHGDPRIQLLARLSVLPNYKPLIGLTLRVDFRQVLQAPSVILAVEVVQDQSDVANKLEAPRQAIVLTLSGHAKQLASIVVSDALQSDTE